jgi:transglutaminase-like putative cysteine protease
VRLDIRYATRFRYAGPVAESQNELRACPATDAHQQLVHYHVTTTPSSRVASYLDYWGTRVDTFGIRAPHDHLEVLAEATVETAPEAARPPSVSLVELDDRGFRDAHLELLQPSPHVRWGREVANAARDCADVAGDDVVALAFAVHDHVAQLDYRPGATFVGVAVDDVYAAGGGVCQDFAHLAVAMYRHLGVPARYVSGFLFTADDSTGQDVHADEVEVETHAWVEVAVPGHGWLALDPTNSQPVGERHVTIGRGRDYDDVSPFRGVFSGTQEHQLEVSVTMRRLALEPRGAVPGHEPRRRPAPEQHHQPQPRYPQQHHQQQQ